VKRFPSSFADGTEISRLLYHAALWGSGRNGTVALRGYPTLQAHARELGRSPSGARVDALCRVIRRLPDPGVTSLVPPTDAADLFGACVDGAPALLELGFPRDEPPGFATRLPSPGRNTRRTPVQIRAVTHHLGGDFELLRVLLRNPGLTDPSLEVVFHAWPPPRPREGRMRIALAHRDGTVPAVLEFGGALDGYVLLCLWDLAMRLRDAEGILPTSPDFAGFASDVTN